MAGEVRIWVTGEVEEFAAVAEGFLAERIERNLLATVLVGAREMPFGSEPPLFALASTSASDPVAATSSSPPVAAAIRTPPWPMMAVGWEESAVAERLMEQWLERDPGLQGVSAPPATARALAQAWRNRTGGSTVLDFSEGMHILTEVVDPLRPARGRLREATDDDLATLVAWEWAFAEESRHSSGRDLEQAVRRRLRHGRQVVWEEGGAPVCTVGFNVIVAGTARIGPVYTPPEHRNRGYASSAVAETSRRLLAAGAERCTLFTDLTNATSNAIYASIGYVRFGDWEEHSFVRPQPAAVRH